LHAEQPRFRPTIGLYLLRQQPKGEFVGGNLREAGSHFVRVQQHDRPGRPCEFHGVQEYNVVKMLVNHTANQPLRSRAGDDDPTSSPGDRRTANKCFRQPDAEPVIPIRDVAEAHQAHAAMEELLELFAEVGHQISSPSFLICS
jgi:hypothetical protein